MSEQLQIIKQERSPAEYLFMRAALKECQAYNEHMVLVLPSGNCFNCQV